MMRGNLFRTNDDFQTTVVGGIYGIILLTTRQNSVCGIKHERQTFHPKLPKLVLDDFNAMTLKMGCPIQQMSRE